MSGHRRLTLTLVYTPSQRYGQYVQGADIHHNPILGGPTLGTFGATTARRSGCWLSVPFGGNPLPLLARLSIRDMGVGPRRWSRFWLRVLGKPSWEVIDGAYPEAPFLPPSLLMGIRSSDDCESTRRCRRCWDRGSWAGAVGPGQRRGQDRPGQVGRSVSPSEYASFG